LLSTETSALDRSSGTINATRETPDGQALTGRLGRGGAQSFRLKRVGFAVLGLGGIAMLMGQAKLDPRQATKVVEAERFVLREAGGKPRAELGFNDGEPSLALFDDRGNRRAGLSVATDGSSSLSLYDKDGKRRVVLHVRPDGEPHLDLYEKNGKNQTGQPDQVPPPNSPVRPAVSAAPEQDERLKKVAALYRPLCQSCHGADGRAARLRSNRSPIPDFSDPSWQASRTDAQLAASILNGRGNEMPAFDDRVSAQQARELVAYIRAFGPAKARKTEAAANDFDRQYQQLRQQYEELEKQLKEIRKP
jgi:mono/diheme cytochrome c family protein